MTEPQDHDLPSELGSPNPSTGEPPALQVPDMPFHPLAEIFPLPGEDELRAMADDIATHGLREPIVTLDDQILDGRCRYLTCKMAGVEPRFENYAGNDPIAYVHSRNIRRRHLTEPQRVMVAARLADLSVGANQHSEGLPIGRASQMLSVSERSVGRAKELIRQGTPELVHAYAAGDVSLYAAARISRLPQQEQQELLKYRGLGSSPASPDDASGPASQSSLFSTPTEAHDRPTPNNDDKSTAAATCFPGWLWGDVIPQPGVTVITGDAATMPIAIKIAETVCRGGDWPDYSPASRGGILWMSAVKDFIEQLRPRITPEMSSFGIHLMPPELDNFGLPIRNFALDLDRLRSRIKGTAGVALVTLDTLSDYVRCGDVKQAIEDLHSAIAALSQFAIEHAVAIVLPCELPPRHRRAITRAVNAFREFSEITTVLVAAKGAGPNSGSLLAAKLPTAAGAREFHFRVRTINSTPTIMWEGLANKTMSGSLFDFEPPIASAFVPPASVSEENRGDAGSDDHACAVHTDGDTGSTTLVPPATSEPLAHTLDAAEAEQSELSKAIPPEVAPQAVPRSGPTSSDPRSGSRSGPRGGRCGRCRNGEIRTAQRNPTRSDHKPRTLRTLPKRRNPNCPTQPRQT